MANLQRADNRGVSTSSSPLERWDPFRMMMNTLLRWDPFGSEVSRLAFGGSEFTPRFDVRQSETGYVIMADLPGVKEEDVGVSLTGNRLTISGRREEERSSAAGPDVAIERAQGSFTRTFSLPDDVDPERLTADLKDGVLAVDVPKRPEAQAKKIPIGKRGSGHGKTRA